MEKEQINELESRKLELQARIAESDRAALDYIKASAGFKRAYPQYAEDYAAAKEELDEAEEEIIEIKKDWSFHIGEWVVAGQEIYYNGKVYVVLQDHRLQEDWKPSEVPALYRLKEDPADEWPEWVQPTGAHDAYAKGAKVTFEGEHYVSLIDANVYSPAAYPAGWQKQ
jgi:hypothetical protein